MSLLPYTIGSPSTVYDQTARNAICVHWHDTSLVPLKLADGTYITFASSPGASPPYHEIMKTVGTPALPAFTSHVNVTVADVPADFPYVGGGSPIRNPNDDSLLMIVHLERWPGDNPTPYYASFGLLKSDDDGDSWTFIDEVIGTEKQFNDAETTQVVNPGGGYCIRVGAYLYSYFMEYPIATFPDSRFNYLSVARVLASDFFDAAEIDTAAAWSKWDGSGWTEDALTGLATPLDGLPVGRHYQAYWDHVSVHAPTGTLLMVMTGAEDETAQDTGTQATFDNAFTDFYISMAHNPVGPWTTPELILSSTYIFNTAIHWDGYKTEMSGGGGITLFHTRDLSIWDNVTINKMRIELPIGSRRTGGNKFRGGPATAVAR